MDRLWPKWTLLYTFPNWIVFTYLLTFAKDLRTWARCFIMIISHNPQCVFFFFHFSINQRRTKEEVAHVKQRATEDICLNIAEESYVDKKAKTKSASIRQYIQYACLTWHFHTEIQQSSEKVLSVCGCYLVEDSIAEVWCDPGFFCI